VAGRAPSVGSQAGRRADTPAELPGQEARAAHRDCLVIDAKKKV